RGGRRERAARAEAERAHGVARGPRGQAGLDGGCRIPIWPGGVGREPLERAERAEPRLPREPAIAGPEDRRLLRAGEEANVAQVAVDRRGRGEGAVGGDDPRVLEAAG